MLPFQVGYEIFIHWLPLFTFIWGAAFGIGVGQKSWKKAILGFSLGGALTAAFYAYILTNYFVGIQAGPHR